MASLIPLEEARQMVTSMVSAGAVVRVPLRAALDRTLAEAVVCDLDYPPFDRAVMDGYAVRSTDVTTAPATLTVAGQLAAGDQPEAALAPGQAWRINTGAPIPRGCDAVVRIEDTQTHDDRVVLRVAAPAGQFIARRGLAVGAGQAVLNPGSRMGPAQIAVAAAAGASTLAVYRQPSVGILCTGSELVEPDSQPIGGQIRNSNRYVLDALIRRTHCRPVDFGVIADDPAALTERLERALGVDLLCTSGGVSMGDFDFVPGCLEECGAAVHFHKVAIKPGKPVLFATTERGTCIFGLPGNPLSVFTAFWLLVRPALARLQGGTCAEPPAALARLTGRIGATGSRRTFRPGRIDPDADGRLEVEPLPSQGSGDPFSMARANALIDTDPQTPARETGDEVRVWRLEGP